MSHTTSATFRLEELAQFLSGSTPSTQAADFWGGDTPWVSAKDLKSFYVSSAIDSLTESGRAAASRVPAGSLLILVRGMTLFKSIPIGVTTREIAINQDVKALVPKPGVSALYLAHYLLAHEASILRLVGAAGHGTGTLPTPKLKTFPVRVPSSTEQDRIVDVLSTWDKAIEKTERLIKVKRLCLSEIGERLLNGSKAERVKLREATRESVRRNGTELGRDQIMGVANDRGMRPMREETIASSIDRYKVVRPRAFAYNPMRLNVGSIAMSSFDSDVLVSPDYVVFECEESKLLPGYLNHLRLTRHWASFFDVAGSGSVRVRIYYDDLAAFSFPLPRIEEQRRIVELLDTAVAEIEVLTRYAEALRRQKRGLMQKLLAGQWRLPVPTNSPEERSSC